jgi:hypothetical protein
MTGCGQDSSGSDIYIYIYIYELNIYFVDFAIVDDPSPVQGHFISAYGRHVSQFMCTLTFSTSISIILI